MSESGRTQSGGAGRRSYTSRMNAVQAGGGKIVAPAWTAFMRDVYDRRPAPPDWVRPDSLITREVDWSNGYLATPFCPQEVRHWDWFYPGTEPTQACPVHAPFGLGVSP